MDNKITARMGLITEEFLAEFCVDIDGDMDILYTNSMTKAFNELTFEKGIDIDIDAVTLNKLLWARDFFEEGDSIDITDEPMYGFGATEDLVLMFLDNIHGETGDRIQPFAWELETVVRKLSEDDAVLLIIIEDHRSATEK